MNVVNIIKKLEKEYRKDEIEWHKGLNPFQILIGTVLSQRTRDKNTKIAVRRLFSKYKTPKEIANAPIKEIQKLIKSSGFYKVKAKYIKKISKIILNKYNGKVPRDRKELLNLPGVGLKTSGIVLVYGYKIPEAIPVDVHVHRISNRIGFIKTRSPKETEMKLKKIVPKKYWIVLNKIFVIHGQKTCLPKNPKCKLCPIKKFCNYYNIIF